MKFENLYAAFFVVRGVEADLSRRLEELNVAVHPNECQLFDADKVIDVEHVEAAVVNAALSFRSKSRVAKSLRLEFLLRLAATDQISEALRLVGVGRETGRIGVCVFGGSPGEVEEAARRLLTTLQGEEDELERAMDEDRFMGIMRTYRIEERQMQSVQASSRFEALKLLVMQKMATSHL